LAFRDRGDAGRQLAARLTDLAGRPDLVVLALPRGGVPVAAAVADALGAPLYVYLVRKLGAPGNPELALGALAEDGTQVLDEGIVAESGATPEFLAESIAHESAVLAERAARLRPWLAPGNLADKVVVVVDDGVATGASVTAALRALQWRGVGQLILAVPVGPRSVLEALGHYADRTEAVVAAQSMMSVGAWYAHFEQVDDDEVLRLLQAAAAR
jgi:predicted phosphoribosyltransferase